MTVANLPANHFKMTLVVEKVNLSTSKMVAQFFDIHLKVGEEVFAGQLINTRGK